MLTGNGTADPDLWESLGNLGVGFFAPASVHDAANTPPSGIECTPAPGPFLPCNDLFDWWTLRSGKVSLVTRQISMRVPVRALQIFYKITVKFSLYSLIYILHIWIQVPKEIDKREWPNLQVSPPLRSCAVLILMRT